MMKLGDDGEALFNKLDCLYRDLGKAYYEGGFEDPLPQLLSYFDEITNLRNEIQEQRNSEEKSVLRCPKCGSELEKDARFCGNCGNKIGGNE